MKTKLAIYGGVFFLALGLAVVKDHSIWAETKDRSPEPAAVEAVAELREGEAGTLKALLTTEVQGENKETLPALLAASEQSPEAKDTAETTVTSESQKMSESEKTAESKNTSETEGAKLPAADTAVTGVDELPADSRPALASDSDAAASLKATEEEDRALVPASLKLQPKSRSVRSLPENKPLKLFTSVPSVTAYNGVSTYIKADTVDGSAAPQGYRYDFFLTLNGRYSYLTSNTVGALIYRLTDPGDYIFKAILTNGEHAIGEGELTVPVWPNTVREETRMAGVYTDKYDLAVGKGAAYISASATPEHRIIKHYDFYETDDAGHVLRWIYGYSGNALLYAPTESGMYRIMVEGTDSMGQRFSGLSPLISVTDGPLSIDYLVTDSPNNVLEREKTPYIKAGVTNASGQKLLYSFSLINKKDHKTYFINQNDHGNLFQRLPMVPIGSYFLKVDIQSAGRTKASRQIPVTVTTSNFKLDYFVATPPYILDSSTDHFYLKAKVSTTLPYSFAFYRLANGQPVELLQKNSHGNLIYLPPSNGLQWVRVCVTSIIGDELQADRTINYIADPPRLTGLTVSPNALAKAGDTLVFRTSSNMAANKSYLFNYTVKDRTGGLHYLTSNRDGVLFYAPTMNGRQQMIVSLVDRRNRTSSLTIDFSVGQGHGRRLIYLSPSNQPANMYNGIRTSERDQMELVAGLVKQELAAYDVTVLLPDYAEEDRLGWRTVGPNNDEAIKGTGRPSLAAAAQAEFYLAIHSNASWGNNTNKVGPMALYHPNSSLSRTVASALVKNALQIAPLGSTVTGLQNGMAAFDGYGYAEIREPMKRGIPSVLFEVEFHDHAKTAQWIVNHRPAIAKSIAKSLIETLGLERVDSIPYPTPGPSSENPQPRPNPTGEIFILGAPSVTERQMRAWAASKGAAAWFIEEIPTFFKISVAAGVDPAVTYAQSALETGYGRFGGVVDASFHNPCGLKTSIGGGDYDRQAHTRFDSWTTGIKAQVDHLALYAGQTGYPLPMNESSNYGVVSRQPGHTPDPRHFPYLFGQAKTVKALGAKWAPSSTYGDRVSGMVREIWRC